MGGPNALTENDFAPSSQVQIESVVELAASNLESGHGVAFHADMANVNGADAKANGSLEVVKEAGKGKVNVPTVICKSARRWIEGGTTLRGGWRGPSIISFRWHCILLLEKWLWKASSVCLCFTAVVRPWFIGNWDPDLFVFFFDCAPPSFDAGRGAVEKTWMSWPVK
jgi:hypothetical protein